ncbi:MAG TPA: Ig-like domain-containing protein, partial [Ornithinibacter sp.]|nr:Ig-like domain-containing protein [Ornithinibacter sp.]
MLVASGLGYVAVASQGTTVHEAALNDAGVWVSSDAQAKFARANVPIGQLDTGVATSVTAGSGLDVLQDGAAVVGVGTGAGQLFPIDPRTSTAGDPAASLVTQSPTPDRFTPSPVDLRGGTIALLDRESGKVWAQRVDSRAGITGGLGELSAAAEPVAEVGKDAAIAVDTTGTVHAVSGATGAVTSIPVVAGTLGAPVVVPTALRSPSPDITAVGSTWVAYDAATDTVHTASVPDGFDAQVTTPGGSRQAALQQPGPDADTVAVAGPDRTALVPLDGGISPGGVRVEERVGRVPGAALVTRPVVLGGCLHAAWAEAGQVFYGANCGRSGDEPTATLPAEGEGETRDGVAFRVNRGLVVLNDLDNGGVWDLDDKPTKIDNWDALVPPTRADDENQKKDENLVDEASLNQPPKAQPDTLSVRPGRTSKLHVLDNDTDVAGSVLSIDQADVSRPTLDGVSATVSADGQAIDVSVPEESANQAFTFDYAVNNGKVKGKGTAKVTVRIVPDSVNGPPRLRQGGAALAKTEYPVIAGKRLSVPVLADWRDPESDVLAARADTEGGVVDGQGRVTLTAPTEVGKQAVAYLVTDGRGGTTEGSVTARVIGTTDSRFVAPRTQPDAVRGVIGKPLQIEPLGNDIAGADPGEPDAVLRLRSEVRPVGPLEVDTDLATGQVTVTGSAPGTYELTYSAQTGAGASPGRVRVDLVVPPEGAPPVAVPDTATLHDQSPVMVDVLANDYSPRGDVLVTASVESTGDNSWIEPSIYQGRWVRIEAGTPSELGASGGRRGVVRYTVSDGTQRTSGQVSVLQQGPLDDAVPLVQDDTATVREGDTVSVPVLDNDTMADGIPLQVDPASVKVISKGDAQRAFASGNVIRYVPEARTLTTEKFVTIEYAAYADGMKDRAQSARVRVQVTPLPNAQRVNQAPVARSFTATVTAGDPITMTVPTFGVDADGDSVSVTGIVGSDGGSVDLTHGRVVAIGPSTIRYEAYPLAAGTEVISYEVQDRFGTRSRAFVRVGVVQPGDPQPPVAVDDEVFAAPGKTVTVKALQNDLIARGDVVEVDTDSLNDDATRRLWRVDEDDTVTTTVPADTSRTHELVYGISDGLFDPSRASVLVRPVTDHVNAPVARDDVAAPKPGETSTLVDVLANDSDVDSDPATLTVVDVLSPDATAEAGRVRVTILDHPYAVPYVIEDEDGARAMALVQVPTGADGQPFVVAGTLVEMGRDSSVTVALGDHVRSPRDRVVSVTTAGTVSASPAENLAVSLDDNRTLTLQSSGGYVGPAAVMLEVTDQDAVDQKDFGTAYVSIPVQVGPKVPLLRCPGSSVRVVAGGLPRVVDIPTVCHAWLPVGMSLDDVAFETRWETEPDASLAVDGPGGRRLTLTADPDARTTRGRLAVTTAGLDQPVTLGVDVVGTDGTDGTVGRDLPPPSLRPISVSGLEEGQSRTLDITGYLDSPLAQPRCAITATRVESG